MRVKETSWHYKVYRYMSTSDQKNPSVCLYWSSIFIGFPIVSFFVTVLYPLIWVADKVEKRFQGKTLCPFGKVEVYPESEPVKGLPNGSLQN